ncbi:MAG: hypothetical protein ACLGH0_10440 [Thermoanaerobaculia bacterium]
MADGWCVVMGRYWWHIAVVGVGLLVVTMIVVALVIVDKNHFGDLVGPLFLPVITSGVLAGSLLTIAAAILWRVRNWRRWFLLAFGVIGVTSPLFGFLFLLPWGVLTLMLPVIIAILIATGRIRLPA